MKDPISLEDRGLDLVLGDGLRWVRRSGDRYGAVLLIRGPAGSGKTLVGFNAALAIAKAASKPIAYGCIELFPTELEAQIHSHRPDRTDVKVRYPDARVQETISDGDLLVEARILDLREGPDALGEQLERFWENLAEEGHTPGVFVIDSLIDGYGVGSSVSREFADAVCRLAAHWGIALVLLEECVPGTMSPWVYAADTVLELGVLTEDVDASRAAPFERRLTVLKHRFGPSDAGPHRFLLEPGLPVRVLPRPSAWLEPWTEDLKAGVPKDPRRHEGMRKLRWPKTPTSNGGNDFPAPALVVAVFGSVPHRVFETARRLESNGDLAGVNLTVSFTQPLGERLLPQRDSNERTLGVAHPYLSAHRFLSVTLEELKEISAIRRVIVADLRTLRSFWNADGLRRAVGVFCLLMRRRGVPVILVESTPSAISMTGTANGAMDFRESGIDAPMCVDFADLSIEVGLKPGLNAPRELVTATDLRTGTATNLT